MSDLTPPPEEQMPEATRARIRARLQAATGAEPRPAGPRWLVPVAAAATVLVVVGVGSWLMTSGPEHANGPVGGPAAVTTSPAGLTTSEVPPAPDPTHAPSLKASSKPKAVVPGDDDDASQERSRTCAQEIRSYGLHGAHKVAEIPHGRSTTSFWESSAQWLVCDDLSAREQQGRPAALLGPHDIGAPYDATRANLAFSSATVSDAAFNPRYMHFFSGGRLFGAVKRIVYSFPDGGRSVAEITTDDSGQTWWAMNYEAYDGVFMRPGTNFLGLDPVQVAVTYTNGATEQVELRFGQDDCAHVNFGC